MIPPPYLLPPSTPLPFPSKSFTYALVSIMDGTNPYAARTPVPQALYPTGVVQTLGVYVVVCRSAVTSEMRFVVLFGSLRLKQPPNAPHITSSTNRPAMATAV